jgi:GTP-binding protein
LSRRQTSQQNVGGAAHFVVGAARANQFPAPDTAEVAFAGRSNVGKSSLLNRLVRRHGLARVSKTPGRTQQINFFAVGDALMLVDLPGYGFARVPAAVQASWKALVERYLTSRKQLRGVVVIIDVRRGVQEEDQRLLDFLHAHEVPAVLVATKIDKLGRGARTQQLSLIAARQSGREIVAFSALSGEGVEAVWSAVRKLAGNSG